MKNQSNMVHPLKKGDKVVICYENFYRNGDLKTTKVPGIFDREEEGFLVAINPHGNETHCSKSLYKGNPITNVMTSKGILSRTHIQYFCETDKHIELREMTSNGIDRILTRLKKVNRFVSFDNGNSFHILQNHWHS